jgi:aminoglycoside 3-N-acetyltransferase
VSTELSVIERSERPVTHEDVRDALHAVGVTPGDTIIAHSSMSQLGWVVGGAHGVVTGVLDAVGPHGTVVMPAQTGISDPSTWVNPPVPDSWWQPIRDHWPAFDPRLTPMRGMGAVVECFARLPDAVHSGHPALGFVAHGAAADELMRPHPLASGLGDDSPLGRLYDAGARIVLIGVGHANDTSLHLAEHRAEWPGKTWGTAGAPMIVDGERRWVTYRHLELAEDDFESIAAEFEASGGEQVRAPLGLGTVLSCDLRSIVDFAVRWMSAHRT